MKRLCFIFVFFSFILFSCDSDSKKENISDVDNVEVNDTSTDTDEINDNPFLDDESDADVDQPFENDTDDITEPDEQEADSDVSSDESPDADTDDDTDIIDDGSCAKISIGKKYDFGTVAHGSKVSKHITLCNSCTETITPDVLKPGEFSGKCGSFNIENVKVNGNSVDTGSGFDILFSMSLGSGECAEMDATYDSGLGEYYPELMYCEVKGSLSDGFDYSVLFTGTSGESAVTTEAACPAVNDLCYIDGVCYAQGATDPTNLCKICNPETPDVWFNASENSVCDDGSLNTTGDKCNSSGVCAGTAGAPVPPEIAEISAGSNFTCALGENGKVYCWGLNNSNQVSPESADFKFLNPVEISVSGGLKSISSGNMHVCAVSNNDTVYCWGNNLNGQLGRTGSDLGAPSAVAGISGAVDVSVNGYHSCALLNDSTVKCWGKNESGTLGDGTTDDSSTPVSVAGLENVSVISAGFYHVCAVIDDGTVKCWGSNEYNQLGTSTADFSSIPVEIEGIDDAVAVSCGRYHSCVLLSTGKVECWGDSDYELLGNYFTLQSNLPVEAMITGKATSVVAGISHSCAVLEDHSAVCWGYNEYGQLGTDYTSGGSFVKYPVDVRNVSGDIEKIACGTAHTCVVFTDGSVRCWGNGAYGALGTGDETSSLIPLEVKW